MARSYQLDFKYTGDIQSVTLKPGLYFLECWGANGGGMYGGTGGYSAGYLSLSSTTKIYLCVGGVGILGIAAEGGWNGGGASGSYSSPQQFSGGGATDLRFAIDVQTRFLVAGGGGGNGGNHNGGNSSEDSGGNGGGLVGGIGTGTSNTNWTDGGGTQNSAGIGEVQTSSATSSGKDASGAIGGAGAGRATGGGGGGGWYGGGGGTWGGGSGGSGYVSTLLNGGTFAKGESGFKANPDTSGNGFIKIIQVGERQTGLNTDNIIDLSNLVGTIILNSAFNGILKLNGSYSIEMWDAQNSRYTSAINRQFSGDFSVIISKTEVRLGSAYYLTSTTSAYLPSLGLATKDLNAGWVDKPSTSKYGCVRITKI